MNNVARSITATRIIGIDPGSRFTGYGIIQVQGNQYKHITSGVIRTGKGEHAERLQIIYQELNTLLIEHVPMVAAVEQVFMQRNVKTALILGQARGAALVALGQHKLNVAEYTARQIKQAVVGYGNAEKLQIQHMVKLLLNLPQAPAEDAADALAVAICHALSSRVVLDSVQCHPR
jgi:crossover junction endodeoxyribonuclease RuvC